MSDHGGGSTGPTNRERVFPPCPPPPPPLVLYVPETLRQVANDDQLERIALIELNFARATAALLVESYAELVKVFQSRNLG